MLLSFLDQFHDRIDYDYFFAEAKVKVKKKV